MEAAGISVAERIEEIPGAAPDERLAEVEASPHARSLFIDVEGRRRGRQRTPSLAAKLDRGLPRRHLRGQPTTGSSPSSRRTSTSACSATCASRRRPRAASRSSSSTSWMAFPGDAADAHNHSPSENHHPCASAKDFFQPLAIGAPVSRCARSPFRPSRMIHFFDPSNEKMAIEGARTSPRSATSCSATSRTRSSPRTTRSPRARGSSRSPTTPTSARLPALDAREQPRQPLGARRPDPAS